MKQKVLCGADVLALRGFNFKGKCGLITNHTGVLRDLTSTIDLLKETCCLTALFAPEHGVHGICTINKTRLPADQNVCKEPLYLYSFF